MKGCSFWGNRARRGSALVSLLWLVAATAHPTDILSPTIRVSSIQSNGWVWISGTGTTNPVITLERSSNLRHWQTIAVLHDDYPSEFGTRFTFIDPEPARSSSRFYRFREAPRTPRDDWKNQIMPDDTFLAHEHGRWVKFTILLDDPTRVYYADGSQYLFHYDFAVSRFEPLRDISYEEFRQITLYNQERRVVVGAVIFPPPELYGYEYGIQFVSEDPLARELVRDLFHLVRSTILVPTWEPGDHLPSFYMPAPEQRVAAEADRAWFETNGIRIASLDRWTSGNTCYSQGWALGTLKFFTGKEIDAAYGDGQLLPTDILLTDEVPSELPYVAGIISLSAATPNSHVAILALSHDIPFVHLVDPIVRERALQLLGRDIAMRAGGPDVGPSSRTPSCVVEFVVLDPPLDAALTAEMLATKQAAAINIAPIARYGAYTAPVDNLTPADIRFFGGKAANYGLLRRTIPSNSPPAIAISFDLWEEFMGQTLSNGNTLRQEISNRLSAYTYPQRIPAIKTALASIRTLIRNETRFTAEQEQAIIDALGMFDSHRNVRFRSSTNVEDTETFSGAGLYDSYSGCLDDDLDGDTTGPSRCDPTEDGERGVFRALRRVFASFYNDNAYLERARRLVDESTVGMAILVHHSTPDEFEMANGVATVENYVIPPLGSSPAWNVLHAILISQSGAISVANPMGGAGPEDVFVYRPHHTNELAVEIRQASSLVPIGDYVMNWDSDYRQLGELLNRVSDAYRAMTGKQHAHLDFEYKKVQPGRLEIKQVRAIPSGQPTNQPAQYLLDEPVTFVPRQGMNSGLYQTHRLKSKWSFRTANRRLIEASSAPIFSELTIEHLNGSRVETFAAPVNVPHVWQMTSLVGPIGVNFGFWSGAPPWPLLLLRDFQFSVRATNTAPQPYVRPGGYGMSTTNVDFMVLIADRPPRSDDQRSQYTYRFTNSPSSTVVFHISYQLDADKSLVGTMQTRIEGLISQPVVLTNFYSQTLGLLHLGAARHFLFEPRLEADLPPSVRDELAARSIRLIYILDMFGLLRWGASASASAPDPFATDPRTNFFNR